MHFKMSRRRADYGKAGTLKIFSKKSTREISRAAILPMKLYWSPEKAHIPAAKEWQ